MSCRRPDELSWFGESSFHSLQRSASRVTNRSDRKLINLFQARSVPKPLTCCWGEEVKAADAAHSLGASTRSAAFYRQTMVLTCRFSVAFSACSDQTSRDQSVLGILCRRQKCSGIKTGRRRPDWTKMGFIERDTSMVSMVSITVGDYGWYNKSVRCKTVLLIF